MQPRAETKRWQGDPRLGGAYLASKGDVALLEQEVAMLMVGQPSSIRIAGFDRRVGALPAELPGSMDGHAAANAWVHANLAELHEHRALVAAREEQEWSLAVGMSRVDTSPAGSALLLYEMAHARERTGKLRALRAVQESRAEPGESEAPCAFERGFADAPSEPTALGRVAAPSEPTALGRVAAPSEPTVLGRVAAPSEPTAPAMVVRACSRNNSLVTIVAALVD